MDSNKATYWIALGVLVLGLNSEYRQGKFVTLHQVADHAEFVLCTATTHAERTLTAALQLVGREARPSDSLLASARNADFDRERAEVLREQARDGAEQLRDQVREQVQVRDQVRDQMVAQMVAQIDAQRDAIRAQVDIRRAEIQRIRDSARSQFRVVRSAEGRVTMTYPSMICPRTKTRIVVNDNVNDNDASDLADNVSDVE